MSGGREFSAKSWMPEGVTKILPGPAAPDLENIAKYLSFDHKISQIGQELAEKFNLSVEIAFVRYRHRFDLLDFSNPRVLEHGKPLPFLTVLTYVIIQGNLAWSYERIWTQDEELLV